MRSRRAPRLALALAVVLAAAGIAGVASAATLTGTVRLDPATIQVDNGATFEVKVISSTTVPISGVSASIVFDKSIVQVTTVTRSAAWASAPIFLAADSTSIATANQKGKLWDVAADFFPPTSVPAGDQDFITVGFRAIGCGTVKMTVPISVSHTDATLLDGRASTYGNSIKLTTSGATVQVCAAGASQSPGGSGGPSASPGDSSSPGPSDSFDANASASPLPSGLGGSPAPSGPAPTASAGEIALAGSTSDQQGWLTFAMAALAVAAAGLALLILVGVIVAIGAAVVGFSVVIRVWRGQSGVPHEPQAAGAGASSEAVTPAAAGSALPTGAAASAPIDGAASATPLPDDAGATGAVATMGVPAAGPPASSPEISTTPTSGPQMQPSGRPQPGLDTSGG